MSKDFKMLASKPIHLIALLASAFVGQSLAACPAVGAKFYVTAKLRGGQSSLSPFAMTLHALARTLC